MELPQELIADADEFYAKRFFYDGGHWNRKFHHDAEIYELRNQGMTFTELAKKFGYKSHSSPRIRYHRYAKQVANKTS